MLEQAGDLWECNGTICITTNGAVKKNGEAVMGRGTALQASRRFPELPKELGARLVNAGNRIYYFPSWNIITLPVKHLWFEKADIDLISNSLHELVILAKYLGPSTIYLPRPGCGNGGLDWADVKPACEAILDNQFVIVDLA